MMDALAIYRGQFKTRKKSHDRVDWDVRSKELIADLLPPIVTRTLKGLRARSSRRH